MASKREENQALADQLRGKVGRDAQEVGKQLSQQVGKVQTVKDISAPTATPKITQEQSAQVRERHVTEKQQQNQIGSPAGGAAKDKSLAEIAQSMRQAGVTSGRAGNDVARPKDTPAVEHKQSRGRGR
jgi:hypothetical protein